MSDELRGAVARAMERTVTDLVVGRFGDPHVGFLVLIHPDREPTVVALTPRTAQSMETVRLVKAETALESDQGKGRFFTIADIREASAALHDIDWAFRIGQYEKEPPEIQARIREGWERRRDMSFRNELEQAAARAARPAKCPSCGRHFTVRGLPAHQSRSRYCSRRLAASGSPQEGPDKEGAER